MTNDGGRRTTAAYHERRRTNDERRQRRIIDPPVFNKQYRLWVFAPQGEHTQTKNVKYHAAAGYTVCINLRKKHIL